MPKFRPRPSHSPTTLLSGRQRRNGNGVPALRCIFCRVTPILRPSHGQAPPWFTPGPDPSPMANAVHPRSNRTLEADMHKYLRGSSIILAGLGLIALTSALGAISIADRIQPSAPMSEPVVAAPAV